jgi:hypothetical protein
MISIWEHVNPGLIKNFYARLCFDIPPPYEAPRNRIATALSTVA